MLGSAGSGAKRLKVNRKNKLLIMTGSIRGLFLSLVIIAALGAVGAAAQSRSVQNADSDFESLKAQYLKLRNTDVDVRQVPMWEGLAQNFETFVGQHPAHPGAPFSLLYSSVLYEHLFRRFGGQDRLRKACDLLRKLSDSYPQDSLADDALIRQGDLLLYDLNDIQTARRVYRQAWERFPQGDMRDVAAARLKSVENGEFAAFLRAQQEPLSSGQDDVEARGQRFLVVVDAGHGGEDFGARGQGDLLEKDVTLAVALELERALGGNPSIRVKLTRRRDAFVPLAERIQFANDYEADLFISLHTNASPHGKLSGLETYYLDNTKDEASRLLAERENGGIAVGTEQGDLQFMLGDLIQNAKLDESIVFAHRLHRALINHVRMKWDNVRDLGVRKAPFYVLVGAHMPCVLVEMFYIDHAIDGNNLASRDFRNSLAQGLASGIAQYAAKVRGGR